VSGRIHKLGLNLIIDNVAAMKEWKAIVEELTAQYVQEEARKSRDDLRPEIHKP